MGRRPNSARNLPQDAAANLLGAHNGEENRHSKGASSMAQDTTANPLALAGRFPGGQSRLGLPPAAADKASSVLHSPPSAGHKGRGSQMCPFGFPCPCGLYREVSALEASRPGRTQREEGPVRLISNLGRREKNQVRSPL